MVKRQYIFPKYIMELIFPLYPPYGNPQAIFAIVIQRPQGHPDEFSQQ